MEIYIIDVTINALATARIEVTTKHDYCTSEKCEKQSNTSLNLQYLDS